jgi:hemerythrin-like domain-containing protein
MSAAAKGPTTIVPASPLCFNRPLDFFACEHLRQRQMLDHFEEAAVAKTLDRRLAIEIVNFLRHDLALHYLDEEEGLFPLMRLRCPKEDDIEQVLSALAILRVGSRALLEVVIAGLEAALVAARPVAPQGSLRQAMVDFARKERRHLVLENCIVLPLARRRLRARDLSGLSARIATRHSA